MVHIWVQVSGPLWVWNHDKYQSGLLNILLLFLVKYVIREFLAHLVRISVVYYPCEIILSHKPMHTRLSDTYVSLPWEKSVPHRYPCEITVANRRKATRGRLLMRDNLHATFFMHDYSFEN